MRENKKILMVTYDFPPIGGGGVQRNLKFIKYLTKLGWDTSVLTVKERDFYVFDDSLLKELNNNTNIYRAYSIDPLSISTKIRKFSTIFKKGKSNFSSQITVNEDAWYVGFYRNIRNWLLLPDGHSGWIPFAYSLGKKIVKENGPDIIFGSFPGPSNAFVTYKISKKFNIPYVIDFRDGWTDDPYTNFSSIFHRKYHEYYEKKIILGAKKIIVYGEPLKEIYEKRYPKLIGNIEVINNGFDPEDFLNLIPKIKSNNKVRLVYSGSMYFDRRETYINFIKAICTFTNLEDKLEIIFVGDRLRWASDLVIEENLENIISFTGYLPHKEALEYLSSADASLIFLQIGDEIALTGKIFEYIGLGLPIIACVEPAGACSMLLKSIEHDQGVCSPSVPEDIATKIQLLIDKKMISLKTSDINAFSRKFHAEKLDKILSELI